MRILASSNCAAEILPAEQVVSVTPEIGAGYVDLYAINNTTGELKAVREETIVLTAASANTTAYDNVATVKMISKATGKELASFEVIQKNYYPEWIEAEGEQVQEILQHQRRVYSHSLSAMTSQRELTR